MPGGISARHLSFIRAHEAQSPGLNVLSFDGKLSKKKNFSKQISNKAQAALFRNTLKKLPRTAGEQTRAIPLMGWGCEEKKGLSAAADNINVDCTVTDIRIGPKKLAELPRVELRSSYLQVFPFQVRLKVSVRSKRSAFAIVMGALKRFWL